MSKSNLNRRNFLKTAAAGATALSLTAASANRVYGANGAIDLPTATWIEREKKGDIKLEVPDAGQDSGLLALAAFFDNARGHKQPLNNADSAALSTLVAMMGRKSIYEKRVVTWEEMA